MKDNIQEDTIWAEVEAPVAAAVPAAVFPEEVFPAEGPEEAVSPEVPEALQASAQAPGVEAASAGAAPEAFPAEARREAPTGEDIHLAVLQAGPRGQTTAAATTVPTIPQVPDPDISAPGL